MKFNSLFHSKLLPEPEKSCNLLKVFLKRSQLPYEMMFILGKTMKMIINELSFYYKKETKEIDTDTIIPYIVVVLIKAITETHQELILE